MSVLPICTNKKIKPTSKRLDKNSLEENWFQTLNNSLIICSISRCWNTNGTSSTNTPFSSGMCRVQHEGTSPREPNNRQLSSACRTIPRRLRQPSSESYIHHVIAANGAGTCSERGCRETRLSEGHTVFVRGSYDGLPNRGCSGKCLFLKLLYISK